MRALPLIALGLVGCAFDPGGAPIGGDDDDGGVITGDGRQPDGAPADAERIWDPSNLDDFSRLDGVTDALTLTPGTWTLDTDAGILRDPGNASVPGLAWSTVAQDTGAPEIQVLAVGRLDLGAAATLRVSGARSLMILSDGPIHILGTLELAVGCTVSSTEDRDRQWCGGPGAGDGAHPDPDSNNRIAGTGCAPGGMGDAGGFSDERGGGGGGFGTIGGNGGGFDNNGSDSQGGEACGSVALEPLRGGSGGGGAGYVANGSDDSRTSGGGGGGAVQLTSRDEILISGTIDAPGAGGAGTAQALTTTIAGTDGGGGGGSGGAILLEAPSITVTAGALVTANGGGGGAGITLDKPGQRGQRSRVRALGGQNDDGTSGGLGAVGAVDGDEATDGAAPGDGGSGGGGAAGRVHLHAAEILVDPSSIIAPAHSETPLFSI